MLAVLWLVQHRIEITLFTYFFTEMEGNTCFCVCHRPTRFNWL